MRVFLCLSFAIVFAISARAEDPEIGKPAPNFTLKDTTGNPHSLADFKGHFVVLEWVNYGCPFVQKYYNSNSMQDLQKMETSKGVTWLTICSSAAGKEGYYTPEQAGYMANQYHAAGTAYLIDAAGKVGRLYAVKTTPEMYIINPKGVLIYKGAIDDRPSRAPVTLIDATNYVKLALEEAMGGREVSNPITQPYGCPVRF